MVLLRCSNTTTVATGCSWAKDTNLRGLSRHRATCKHYQKASTLATEKRWERAKESIKELHKLAPHRDRLPQDSISTVSNLFVSLENSDVVVNLSYQTSPLEPIRFRKDRSLKPIAHCRSNAFSGKPDLEGKPSNCIGPDTSNARVGALEFIAQDSDVVMEDIAEGYPDIPGMYFVY